MFKKLLAISLFSFILIGCGNNDTKLDFSSKEAYVESISKVGEKLNDADKVAFGRAMYNVNMAANSNEANGGDDDKVFAELKHKLDGKTAHEIISEFNK